MVAARAATLATVSARVPPGVLVILSSTSIQLGTAIATTAFAAAGPIDAVWVRGLVGMVLLAAWTRPDPRRISREQWLAIVPYGLALGAMVLGIYLALAEAPLGIVSAILMLGPIVVSAAGYRSVVELAALALAGIGAIVVSLADGVDGPISPVGIALAFGSAAAFGAYIVTGKRVGRLVPGFDGLVMAMAVALIAQAPFALAAFHPGVLEPQVLVTLAVAGVLASLLPFALELTAMRRLSAATFGLLLSFEPAIAALAGLVIRGQVLVPSQAAGIAIIVAASAISLGPRGWTRRLGSYNRRLMADPTVATLATVPLFSGLSTGDLATIASATVSRDVPAGTEITREGDPGEEFFVVADGEIGVSINGQEVRRLGAGDYFGEIALVFGGTRTATTVTARPSRLLVLDRAAFDAMVRRYPRIEDKILTTVSERMRYR